MSVQIPRDMPAIGRRHPSRSVKRLDGGARRFGKPTEGVDNRQPAKTGFVERYPRGELNLGFRSTFFDQGQYGFLVVNAHPSGADGSHVVVDLSGTHNPERFGADGDREELPVLPHQVEVMKRPEIRVASAIRFQRFYSVSHFIGEPLYEFVPLVGSCGERGVIPSDREIRFVLPTCAVAPTQGSRENIESGSEAVEISADLDIEYERQRLLYERYHHIIRGLRWLIFDDHVNVVVHPSAQPDLEGIEVGYGPVDVGLGFEEIGAHD